MSAEVNESMMLSALYADKFGVNPDSVELLAASGGYRRYYRLKSYERGDVIGTYGDDISENRAFLYLDDALRRAGCAVPEVYAVSDDESCYLQEDFGDLQLLSIIQKEPDFGFDLLKEAVGDLVRIQCASTIDFNDERLQKTFDAEMVMRDLNYFKYCFMKVAGVEVDEDALQSDFNAVCADVATATQRLSGFMYRDCQSRNIMVNDGRLHWIDFQGGRKGPMIYDVVSLLWQAKAGLSASQRKELLDVYFAEMVKYCDYPMEWRGKDVGLFALLRTLQVLGAYGFRGLTQHRAHFVTSIPAAFGNVRELLESGTVDMYPALKDALSRLCDLERFKVESSDGKLTVEVFSFSYKKGYPEDLSGNGGGYMFDCRAMHNPGRYAEYRSLTGRDKAVIDFLEDRGEVQDFLACVYPMARKAVDRYLHRGFTHLQFGFGCTGGQHRSVYCAEKLAHYLRNEIADAALRIVLRHREQQIEDEL